MKPEPTPWRALIAVARELGVPPREFWRLSLREWRALSAPSAQAGHLARSDFDFLSAQFPDLPHDNS